MTSYKPYKYTKEDKQWKKDGAKTSRNFNRTEKDMCERHEGNVYTKGNNEKYPGCGTGWCCSPLVNTLELEEDSPIPIKPESIKKKKFKVVKKSTGVSKPKAPKDVVVKSEPLSHESLHYAKMSHKEKMKLLFGSDSDEEELLPLNEKFVENLKLLEDIMKSQGEVFRSRAYKKAKESIIGYQEDILSVSDIQHLAGIGKTIVEKLTELVLTGKISVIEKHKQNPIFLFNNIFGVGPKKANELYRVNRIDSIEELKTNLQLLNKKQKIGLKYYDDLQLRIPREEIDQYNILLTQLFESVKFPTSQFKIVGSYRRGKSESGDIDILITDLENNVSIFNRFLDVLIKEGILIEILSKGDVKSLAISKLGENPARRIDFLYTPWNEFTFAQLYFTGSQAFNIGMRNRALEYGLSMNEHQFTVKSTLKKPLPKSFLDEKSVFTYLDLEYREPFERIDASSLIEKKSKKKVVIKKKTSTPVPEEPITTEVPVVEGESMPSLEKSNCISGNLGKIVFSGDVLLANEYINKDGEKALDPTGWWASEKYDGYRAIWNGNTFVSRTGKPIIVPDWFITLMPPSIALDGELWVGRAKFDKCGIFRKKTPITQEWIDWEVMYNVYDLPTSKKRFEERMKELKQIVEERCKCMIQLKLPMEIIDVQCPLIYTEHVKVKSDEHLDHMFKNVVDNKGEGMMIRKPGSYYEMKRSSTLLKYKQFFDTECIIVGYKPGTKKYEGMLGSFECRLLEGNTEKSFYVSGMNDDIRTNYLTTHPIGTIITIIYNELTKTGIPRFVRYLRKRDDHDL